MNIGVIGCGYVGLSNAVILAYKNNVFVWDINSNKLDMIENRKIPFEDADLAKALEDSKIQLNVCRSLEQMIENTEIFIIALPTDYNQQTNSLNTSSIEQTIEQIIVGVKSQKCRIIIKSTVPVGFTISMREKYEFDQIFFMPEFLREGSAYKDTMYPDRIVFGGDELEIGDITKVYLDSVQAVSGIKPELFYMDVTEAESVKLFSNAYLAMRIAFFNEVDCFAETRNMNSAQLIRAICADSRIGNYYNNPSFGYGGYCLPKDTEQLANIIGEEGILTGAIGKSNNQRKKYITRRIIDSYSSVGVYRLQSKRGSDNKRNAVILEIVEALLKAGKNVYLYEPEIDIPDSLDGVEIVSNLDSLNEKCEVIVANRMDNDLIPYMNKVYTRDVLMVEK